ncbi:MAG: DegT/DnrJ/EryC1/StrS family aminotransferase [Nanoarchaeota archaeon]|nr:DegT/DnrJ/EryC1/StrS family aminotransferase [Nanoarchaeota archaeon]
MRKKRIIRTGYFEINELEKKALIEVLESGRITEFKKTKEFEKKWAEKVGTKYSIAVNSGTSALISGLYALKYLSGDEKRKKVITTPLTYIADGNAIILSGLEPVFGDIEEETFSIQPSEIERILREQDPEEFLAILPVHLMGYPCNMDEINRIAKEHNLFVFEDAAQAHGTKYKGKVVGSIGDLSNFSFYIAHNLQAGELGAVNTNNKEIRNLVKKIKANGRVCSCDLCKRMEGKCPEILKNLKNGGDENYDPRFTHDIFGFNFKTTEFSTALATYRIKEIDKINNVRRNNLLYLNEGLMKHGEVLRLPKFSEDVSYLAYPLIVKKGGIKNIRSELEKKGVETRSLFGCIPTQQPSFSYMREEYLGKLPNAEDIGKKGFYIGVHQDLTQEDLNYVIDSFNEVLSV